MTGRSIDRIIPPDYIQMHESRMWYSENDRCRNASEITEIKDARASSTFYGIKILQNVP